MLRITLVAAFTAISALSGMGVRASVNPACPPPDLCFTECGGGESGNNPLPPSTVSYCLNEASTAWNKTVESLEYAYSTGELTIKPIDQAGVNYLKVSYAGSEILLIEPI